MNRFFNIENKVTEFVDKIFENNDFLSKFGVVPEDNYFSKNNNKKDNFWNETHQKYEKYEGDKLVKRHETIYKNGEKVKDEKYEAPTNTLENTKEEPKICKCENTENNGVCKCGKQNGRCGQDENVVNDDLVQRGFEDIVRRGTQQLYDENTSLKEQNNKLQEENNNLKGEIVKYQTELENIDGFIKIYQETLREQNDKIQELVDKLKQYQEIENMINQIRK